ncbi:MAG: DUF4912 domain-containing protein, partial [Gemmataceae bacterium]
MTRDQLQACTKKILLILAREQGIPCWHDMTKNELVSALAKRSRGSVSALPPANGSANGKHPSVRSRSRVAARNGNPSHNAAPAQNAAARDTSNTASAEEQIESSKYNVGIPTRDLSAKVPKDLPTGYGKDRIALMVRDPYWLHCYWELTHQAIQRAEAALSQEWHTAKPILRLLDVSSRDTTSTSETVVRDIDIHGGCNNWYIDVANPPRSFRVDIGYLTRGGKFYDLARSNVVTTPRAGISDVIDENWADIDAKNADRIYAMSSGFDPTASSLELKQLFEEHLHRPLGSPSVTSFGSGGLGLGGKPRKFWFQLDAELIVYGATEPNARVMLQGQPIKLRPDGTFTIRFSLPDGRQIIPATAVSPDGIEER